MTFSTGLVFALGALVGALGPLGSQLLAAWAAPRTRWFGLYFQAKASGYTAVLEQIGEFAFGPTEQEKYWTFLAAYENALLFASEAVAKELSGLGVAAQRLRRAATDGERDKLLISTWYNATKAVSAAMREDLRRLPKL